MSFRMEGEIRSVATAWKLNEKIEQKKGGNCFDEKLEELNFFYKLKIIPPPTQKKVHYVFCT